MRNFGILALFLLLTTSAPGQPELPSLDPAPQQIAWADASPDPYLGARDFQAILLEPNTWVAQAEVEKINERLKALGVPALPLRKMPEERLNEHYIWVAVEPTMRMPKLLHPLPVPVAGGYRLAVGDSMIYLLGQDLAGLQRGLVALTQLLTPDARFPKVLISDNPPGSIPRPRPVLPQARLEPGVNAQGFPLIRLALRQEEKVLGSIEIRTPEALESWTKGTDARALLYQDLRSPEWPATLAAQPTSLPVPWESSPDRASYTLSLDNGCRVAVQAVWRAPSLSIEYTFFNGLPETLARVQTVTCVQLQGIAALRDPLAQRTVVPFQGIGRPLIGLIPGFTPYPTEKADFQRLIAYCAGAVRLYSDCPHKEPHPGYPNDPEKVIQSWQATDTVDHPSLMQIASDQLWGVRVTSPQATRVWSNPGVSCLHADPHSGEVAPGQEVRLALEVELFQTPLAQMVR